MKEDIEKQKNVISREALEKRMGEYQQEFVKLQQNYLEYQQELGQEAGCTKSILVNLQGVVSTSATRASTTPSSIRAPSCGRARSTTSPAR